MKKNIFPSFKHSLTIILLLFLLIFFVQCKDDEDKQGLHISFAVLQPESDIYLYSIDNTEYPIYKKKLNKKELWIDLNVGNYTLVIYPKSFYQSISIQIQDKKFLSISYDETGYVQYNK